MSRRAYPCFDVQMYMSMGNWGQAYNEFYEGFRNYQEAGNPNAKVRGWGGAE